MRFLKILRLYPLSRQNLMWFVDKHCNVGFQFQPYGRPVMVVVWGVHRNYNFYAFEMNGISGS